MIGGTRIIGGDKTAYIRGYREGLLECREKGYDPSEIYRLLLVWNYKLHKEAFEIEEGNPLEATRISAHHSAIFDVFQELNGLLSLFGKEFEKQVKEIIDRQVKEVLDTWKVQAKT